MATTFANVDPVVLNPPIAPTEELELPDNLSTVDDVIDIARDCYNTLQGIASKIGLSFPGDFPEGSISEWFIEPVTGDFNKIAAGGYAAYNAGQALSSVSHNIVVNNGKLVGAWSGGASTSFVLTTALYATMAKAAGFLLKQTKPIFEGIATVSKGAGELLGRLLGELVDLCVTLIKFLGKKFSGAAASIGSWLWDALKGFEDVRELVADIRTAYEAVDRLIGFKDEVKAYYETAKTSFGVFEELKNLAALLPQVVTDPLHQGDELAEQLRRLEKKMDKQREKMGDVQDAIDERADEGRDNTDSDLSDG